MGNQAVALRVAPFLRIECKFWLTDDGWNGSCDQPSITVRAGSFEFAKSEMEIALGNTLSPFCAKPKEQPQEKLPKVRDCAEHILRERYSAFRRARTNRSRAEWRSCPY